MDAQSISSTDFQFPGQTSVYHGKVRDIYVINDELFISIATDRISAFDVILERTIPFKGQVLNELAAYFLRATENIIPNWLVATPDPTVSVGHKAEPIMLEIVVRGYLIGHAWREYEAGKRELCGVALPDGMSEYQAFPEPIITPTTKADAGHDQDISIEDAIASGITTQEEAAKITEIALALFKRGQEMALEKDLILADTKYELGHFDGKLMLIDEIHTPDSSRYFYKDSYDSYIAGDQSQPVRQLSKEFVRQWLMDNGFSGKAGDIQPAMEDGFVQQVSDRYIELYERMIGGPFVKAETEEVAMRIENNIKNYLRENLS